MITQYRSDKRRSIQRGKHDIHLTFEEQKQPGRPPVGFGLLAGFDETRLPPNGVNALRPWRARKSSPMFIGVRGRRKLRPAVHGWVHAGEFQRMTIGRGIRFKETNVLLTGFTHLFRISLHPSEVGLDSVHKQQRYALGQRHNLMCVIASRDGRKQSLRILQDAVIYSSVLDSGHHIVHELASGRSAWLHVVNGEAALQDIILTEATGQASRAAPRFPSRLKRTPRSFLWILARRPACYCDAATGVERSFSK